ncbi:Uncharacterized membrane protein YdjX, TVP38/TMEM64 family, SNARE-associated domain [Halopelagius inordinatus]|uniref:Uncharacterized membrane protein YdjX, TVP38/TMEM64 family, SNARE-associated domain n=1 Tax=Halopelagius inordinatus TaxID=553467 RepID=A0A1I2S2Z2_9EURY|nr:VTT domain-containing protein [Halopelagius inordinatus]SFG45187.1 Uncharacterized membrane protein YdjX, TVP38/TMEM64 family, SNARE-associated domain [Halopelagius inordinatus]
MRRPRFGVRVGVGGVLAAVLVAAAVTSPDAALNRLAWATADPTRFVAAAVCLALVRPLLAWPTTILAVVVGYAFGVVGVPFALALIVLTSVPPFLFARRVGRESRVAAAGEAFVERTGDVRSVVASRLVPAPSDVVSVAAGVSGVRLRAFVVGTAVGETPWALAGVLAGASAETLAAGDVAGAMDVRLAAATAFVAAVLVAPTLYEWYGERTRDGDAA